MLDDAESFCWLQVLTLVGCLANWVALYWGPTVVTNSTVFMRSKTCFLGCKKILLCVYSTHTHPNYVHTTKILRSTFALMNTHNTHIHTYTKKKFLHLDNHINSNFFLFQKSSKEVTKSSRGKLPSPKSRYKKKSNYTGFQEVPAGQISDYLRTYKVVFFPSAIVP